MKYWQKTFIATLVLFLIAFDVAIFLIAGISYQNSIDSEKQKDLGEQYFISVSLANDILSIQSRNGYSEEETDAALLSLFQSYGDYYGKQDVKIGIYYNGVEVYSTLPFFEGEKPELDNVEGMRNLFLRVVGNNEFIYISGLLPPPVDAYALVYAKSLNEIAASQQELIGMLLIASVLISLALAIALFLLLRQLSRPIRRLTETTQRIAAGEYGERANIKGKDEIAQLAGSFNDMADEVQTQMNTLERSALQKQQFIDNLAHELRTPLTSISGFAEYIQLTATTEEDRLTATNYIIGESNRLKEIAYKLMDMAVLREQGIEKKPLDVHSLIEKSLAVTAVNAEEQHVQTIAEIQDIDLCGDMALMESMVVNLIDNGLKACEEDGRVVVRTFYDADHNPCISVEDNGRGMSQEQLEQVIQPFYRVDKSRSRQGGGAGLGLSLCRQIVEAHGGILNFESALNEGTIVTAIFYKTETECSKDGNK